MSTYTKFQKSDKKAKESKSPVKGQERQKSHNAIKINGIEKKPMLLNLLKKIEVKSSVKSGQYTHRPVDMKLGHELDSDYTLAKMARYHRTKKDTESRGKNYSKGSKRKQSRPK